MVFQEEGRFADFEGLYVLHVNPFQVIEVHDPINRVTLRKPTQGVWQDVIAIPPASFDNDGKLIEAGRVVIRHRFADFAGSSVLHCHMLAHEDGRTRSKSTPTAHVRTTGDHHVQVRSAC